MNAPDPIPGPTVEAPPPEAPAASESLEPYVPDEIANPVNGALVPAGDLKAVGENIELLRRAKGAVDLALRQLTDAVRMAARSEGRRTFHVDGVSIVLGSETEVEWDAEELVIGLAKAGCPQPRLNELVSTEVTYKVNAAVAKQIAGANPEYKAVIDRCQRRVPKRPYANVKLA